MFETAERDLVLPKKEYRARAQAVRTGLLEVQRRLAGASFPVIVLVNGVEGAGKGEVVNLLNEWLDARHVVTHAFGEPTEEESHRPEYWRYWMALPPAGKIGILIGNWYTKPIIDHTFGKTSRAEYQAELARIKSLERALADDGAALVKVWLHVSKAHQRRQFKKLEKDPDSSWRVNKRDWKFSKRYDDFVPVCERAIRQTSTLHAPWLVVAAADRRYRDITVAEYLRDRVSEKLDARGERPPPTPLEEIENPDTILDDLDLTKSLPRKRYEARLRKLQARLHRLARDADRKRRSTIVVFEGWDAAGKGGCIRRMIRPLDARHYRVIPIAAPTEEERAHHYLWRFWRHLPRLGRFTIYDRSWYGRVLVERVEGFATEDEWRRAYEEINELEAELVEHGIVLVKFWLHVSQEEQLRRFQEREQTPWKKHKITEEDYRNRAKANLYEAAVNEMIGRTSTQDAPWTLVEADDKLYARIKVLETVTGRLEGALG